MDATTLTASQLLCVIRALCVSIRYFQFICYCNMISLHTYKSYCAVTKLFTSILTPQQPSGSLAVVQGISYPRLDQPHPQQDKGKKADGMKMRSSTKHSAKIKLHCYRHRIFMYISYQGIHTDNIYFKFKQVKVQPAP